MFEPQSSVMIKLASAIKPVQNQYQSSESKNDRATQYRTLSFAAVNMTD